MLARVFGNQRDLALLLVRIVLGGIFILYGWKHIEGLTGYTNLFVALNIPAAQVLAPLIAWLEFLGGIAILAGIFTRYSGLLLAGLMVVAILMVKFPAATANPEDILGLTNSQSASWNIDLSLLTMSLALLLLGPGKWSLEMALFKKEL